MLTLEGVVQLSKIMHSGLTALNLSEKAHNFPLTKLQYNSVVPKAEEQSFIKATQVERRTRHRRLCVCALFSCVVLQQHTGMFCILGHMWHEILLYMEEKYNFHCTKTLQNLSSLVIRKESIKGTEQMERKKNNGWLNTSRVKLKIYSLPTVTPLRDLRCLSFLHLYKRCSPAPRSQLLRHWFYRCTWYIL